MADDLTVSATEANRSFSRLLRAAQSGACVTITSRGEPVVRMVAVSEAEKRAEAERRRTALEALQAHWATITPTVVGPWTREELYERD